MRIKENIHQIKNTFFVTEEIERLVYIYLIEGREGCYLIDTGVDGAEKIVETYLQGIGKRLSDIKGILLTHAHPDHIGAAAKIKEESGCVVYGSRIEQGWIEDIEKQLQERPIPNFHKLVNRSVKVNYMTEDKELLYLEPEVTIKIMNTEGHSRGSVSFLYQEKNVLFTGDAIPVKGDVPIFTDYSASILSLKKLYEQSVDYYCPAWAEVWDREVGKDMIMSAIGLLEELGYIIRAHLSQMPEIEMKVLLNDVCKALGIEGVEQNPLFLTSIYSIIEDQAKE